jgi:hypothetical protein
VHHFKLVPGCLGRLSEKKPGVHEVHRENGEYDHASVEDVEIEFRVNDTPLPAVLELDCSIDRAAVIIGFIKQDLIEG